MTDFLTSSVESGYVVRTLYLLPALIDVCTPEAWRVYIAAGHIIAVYASTFAVIIALLPAVQPCDWRVRRNWMRRNRECYDPERETERPKGKSTYFR